jgi:uncharacterized protein involved in response to NO
MTRASYLEEPYRLFFPAGLLVGFYGVMLWPLWLWGGLDRYPGIVHARLMVMGMLGAFVIGFLGTAMPRMIGVKSLGVGPVLVIGIAWTGSVVAHGLSVVWLGDLLFGIALILLATAILMPFPRRSDIPPPAFILTGFGVLLGAVGSILLAWSEVAGGSGPLYRFGRVALHEGFLLGTVGGVGAFFFPRLWGSKTKQMFPDMVRPDLAWSRQARIALWVGIGLVAGCVIDASGWVSIGSIVRLSAFGFFAASEVGASIGLRSESTLGSLARLGLYLVPVGLFLEAVVSPGRIAAVRHILMVGGFNLIFFAVATRVIFGHSGARAETTGRMVFMRWIGGLILTAAATRVSADLFPAVYESHLGYAAVLWLAGTLLWSGLVLWRVLIPDPGPD